MKTTNGVVVAEMSILVLDEVAPIPMGLTGEIWTTFGHPMTWQLKMVPVFEVAQEQTAALGQVPDGFGSRRTQQFFFGHIPADQFFHLKLLHSVGVYGPEWCIRSRGNTVMTPGILFPATDLVGFD